VDVVSDKGDHLRPIELSMNVLDHLGDPRVASKAMVMMGMQDIQLDVLFVRDVEKSLIAKEVAIL